jgi:hypothetical protein
MPMPRRFWRKIFQVPHNKPLRLQENTEYPARGTGNIPLTGSTRSGRLLPKAAEAAENCFPATKAGDTDTPTTKNAKDELSF